MITIITIIIVSMLGIFSPIVSPGVNLSDFNLFSQVSSINSKLKKSSLSEVNPLESLSNVTAPLDSIWETIGARLNFQDLDGGLKGFLNSMDGRALKSSLGDSLDGQDTSTSWQVLGIVKSALILTANILVAVLEIALWLLRGILRLFN